MDWTWHIDGWFIWWPSCFRSPDEVVMVMKYLAVIPVVGWVNLYRHNRWTPKLLGRNRPSGNLMSFNRSQPFGSILLVFWTFDSIDLGKLPLVKDIWRFFGGKLWCFPATWSLANPGRALKSRNDWQNWPLKGLLERNISWCLMASHMSFWLVVWLPFFIFPYIGNNHPNWRSYFSEGWPNHQPGFICIFSIKTCFGSQSRGRILEFRTCIQFETTKGLKDQGVSSMCLNCSRNSAVSTSYSTHFMI